MSGGEVLVEFDGDGVEPDTIDSPNVLELVAAFAALLVQLAKDGPQVELKGLEVRNKCAAFVLKSDAASEALRALCDLAAENIANNPQNNNVRRIHRAHRKLPSNYSTTIQVGDWKRKLEPEPELPTFVERVEMRASVIRVGGERAPTVVLKARGEKRAFTLATKEQNARQLGKMLYEPIDIDARIERNSKGAISGGELIGFEVVTKGGAARAWRAWFADAGASWNDVADIEAELESDRDN